MNEQEPYDAPPSPPPQTNTLGIVGFVLSFCISPLGLLLSLIALAKTPRGFAIAGVVIGLIGSALWGLLIAGGVLFGAALFDVATIVNDREQISQAIETYRTNNNGSYPPDLAALNLPADILEDYQGQAYGYEFDQDAETWTLIFVGFDGVPDSGDEVSLTSEMSSTAAGQALGEALGEDVQSGR